MPRYPRKGTLINLFNRYNELLSLQPNKFTVREYSKRNAFYTVCTWLNQDLENYWRYIKDCTMPSNTSWNKVNFVNVNLSAEQLRRFDESVSDLYADLDTLLTRTVESDAKLSINYNAERGAFFCTVVTLDNHKTSPNMGFSSFSGDCVESLLLTLYKYIYVLDFDLTSTGQLQNSQRG